MLAVLFCCSEKSSPQVAVHALAVPLAPPFHGVHQVGSIDDQLELLIPVHPLHDMQQSPDLGARHGLLSWNKAVNAGDFARLGVYHCDSGSAIGCSLHLLRAAAAVRCCRRRLVEDFVEVTKDDGLAFRRD